MNMRENLILAALAGMVALPPQAEPDLNTRVEALEQQLAEATVMRDLLLADLQGVTADVLELQKYLEAQAAAARDFHGVLQVVEDGGYAVGQNWQSRKNLLDGLRVMTDARQKQLPGRGKAKQPEGDGAVADSGQ